MSIHYNPVKKEFIGIPEDPAVQAEMRKLYEERQDELAKQFIADLTAIYHYEMAIDDDADDFVCTDEGCFCDQDVSAIAGRMVARGWTKKD